MWTLNSEKAVVINEITAFLIEINMVEFKVS